MRLAFMAAILGATAVAAASAACGDDGGGGAGGNGEEAVDCTATDWDCATVCAHRKAICEDATCAEDPQTCVDEGCESECSATKATLDAIPAEQRKFVLGTFNCMAGRDSCVAFSLCSADCFGR